MEINRIKSVMVTYLNMGRWNLITKEKMENYCKGKDDEQVSVNDNLESLFQDLRLGKEPDEHTVQSYFLPKLTKEEFKMVQSKDPIYLETFSSSNPDVKEIEMMLSESDSKFVDGYCLRRTYPW